MVVVYGRQHPGDSGGGNQRYIAIENNHFSLIPQFSQSTLNRMASAKLFTLLDHDKCSFRISSTNNICAVTSDNNLMGISDCISCVQYMGQHWLAGELMEDFWQLRTHPRAFACCENNDVCFCHGIFTFTLF